MWILPKQLHTSAFVADTKALGLDSEEFSQICEKSLTWRGKDSLSQTWLQRWKRENWMQHLCSRTLRPSLTQGFVTKWISSLGDSRASLSQVLENVKQQKTQDTSSLSSQTESETVNLELSFSKTWKESSPQKPQTENQFSNMSSEHWKAWVTEQRQEYSQRVKSVHPTRESVSSSWGTPQTSDYVEGARTKTTSNQKCLGRDLNELAERTKIGNHPSTVLQLDQTNPSTSGKSQESWNTPQVDDAKNVDPSAKRRKTLVSQTGKLNPNWVEQLMGLPVGWTQLPTAWTDSGSLGTASSQPQPPKPLLHSSNDQNEK